MNRPLHLARKDARRLAGSLGFWLALFPLPAALIVLHAAGRLNGLGTGAPEALGSVHRVLGVAGFLLAVQLALEDPLHDADAGWRTRPITFRDLFLAKLGLACAALVAAPVALLALVWTAAGFTPLDIVALALDQAAIHVLIAGFGLLLGALNRNLGQALLWLVGALVGLVAVIAVLDESIDRVTGLPLHAAAFVALACALWAAYRPRFSRAIGGGLGFAAVALTAVGIFFAPPGPKSPAVEERPGQALVAGAEIRTGSERLRLVRVKPDAKDATAALPLLRLEWRQLAPRPSVLWCEPRDLPPRPIVTSTGRLQVPPQAAAAHSSHLAGMRLTRYELVLPAAECEGATWHPADSPQTVSVPSP